MTLSVHEQYQEHGVDNFYNFHGEDYINHHEGIIQEHLSHWSTHLNLSSESTVLDLCSGDGLVTKHLSKTLKAKFLGIDPFLFNRYQKETGFPCLPLDFKSLSQSSDMIDQKFDVIICSFALHLCPASLLPLVLFNLSQLSNTMIIISPHKKPDIHNFWSLKEELKKDKVISKLFLKN